MTIDVTPVAPVNPPVRVVLNLTANEWADLRKMVMSYQSTDVHRIHSGTYDFAAVQNAFKPLGF